MDAKFLAVEAALKYLEQQTVFGLGAGSTVTMIVEGLRTTRTDYGELIIASPSPETRQRLSHYGFQVADTGSLKQLGVYIDGCDQIDHQLQVLKSGGGIHTQEKILASLADEFVIVGDESKLADRFSTGIPLVLEILPEATGYVMKRMAEEFYHPRKQVRMKPGEDGEIVTVNGNHLLDIWFHEWPDLARVQDYVKSLTGVVDISLFYGLCRKAFIGYSGGVRTLQRNA